MQRILECLAEWGGVEKKWKHTINLVASGKNGKTAEKKTLYGTQGTLDLWILGLNEAKDTRVKLVKIDKEKFL